VLHTISLSETARDISRRHETRTSLVQQGAETGYKL
jgi:hypothetical protein